MDIKFILIIAVILGVIILVGGGLFYWIYLGLRPKKMTWNARVYQLGEGVIPPIFMDGKAVNSYKLHELKPYTLDVVEKIDKKSGGTNFWLQKLNKAVPVVTANCVETWEQGKKWVNVLIEEDTCTLLTAGYDKQTAQRIFKPMPHDRVNMMKTEIMERKARVENTGDVLSKITPWVVVGICMLGLVAVVYFEVQGAIKIAEMNNEGSDKVSNALNSYMCIDNNTIQARQPVRENPPTIPP